MQVLVTGGAGYIGSHAAQRLLAAGHDVTVVDNLSRGHREAAPAGRLIVADLRETSRLVEILRQQRIDAVVHFAALALVGESVGEPSLYWQNNVVGSLSLFEAMRRAKVGRLIFSSTTATYGEAHSDPIHEELPQEPINPYGRTKLVVEQAIQDFAAAYGWGYALLRYFNAAGASSDGALGEDHHPETHLIPIVLDVALGRRAEITIFGDDWPTPDGTCVRDYVHVEDLAEAHHLALERLDPARPLAVNLGAGKGTSVREVIDACREITGRPIPARVGPRRLGDPPILVADPSRARELLDWEPKQSHIRRIVETAWQWRLRHPRGYAVRPAVLPAAAPAGLSMPLDPAPLPHATSHH